MRFFALWHGEVSDLVWFRVYLEPLVQVVEGFLHIFSVQDDDSFEGGVDELAAEELGADVEEFFVFGGVFVPGFEVVDEELEDFGFVEFGVVFEFGEFELG